MPLATMDALPGNSPRRLCIPFTKIDAISLIHNMRSWMQSERAKAEAEAVGSDLIFVKRGIAHLEDVIERKWPSGANDYSFEMFGVDNLENERQRELADDFADEYWTSCAESC